MTTRATAPLRDSLSAPVTRVVDIDGTPMSALVCEAPDPRAVLVLFHGGATDSGYFDCPGHPEYSLLRTAPALGYSAIALDRPGYGRSAPHASEIADIDTRLDLAFGAIEALLAGHDRGAGLFLWAHSVGCELATRMAADPRAQRFLGLELSGTGLEHQGPAHRVLGSSERNADPKQVRELLWKPEHLYPTPLLGGSVIGSRTPSYESNVVRTWPRQSFPELASRIPIPVHFTAGEHERVWRNDPDALCEISALFTAAAWVEARTQWGGGHNLSVGHTARAYHLSVLSFVEECIDGTRHSGESARPIFGTTELDAL